jgi:hypothetical protein
VKLAISESSLWALIINGSPMAPYLEVSGATVTIFDNHLETDSGPVQWYRSPSLEKRGKGRFGDKCPGFIGKSPSIPLFQRGT